MPEFVKHENFFSRLADAKERANDLFTNALYCVRQALEEEDVKTRVHYSNLAMIDLQASLRYLGYVTDVEKRADEILEQAKREKEGKRKGKDENLGDC